MNTKKLLLIILAMLLIVSILGACAPPVEEPAAEVRVAIVMASGIDDASWSQAGYEGLVRAQEEYGIEIAYSELVPFADIERALRDYATQDFDFIICHSSIAKDAVMNVAADFPEISFLWTDGDEAAENVAVLRPFTAEASYLAGLLAGKMTETGIVGLVGAMDIPSTHRGYAGFEQGLKEANPDATLLINWTGDFLDVAAGKEAAMSQIESGADFLIANGGSNDIGTIQAAAETGTPVIGCINDQYELGPEVVYTSVELGLPRWHSLHHREIHRWHV